MAKYELGALVRHPQCPQWGLGKVVGVAGPTLSVFFRGASGTTAAEVVKKINVGQRPLDVAPVQSDPWLDHLALDAGGHPLVTRRRVLFDEALRRFRAAFPGGFADPSLAPREALTRAGEALRAVLDTDTQLEEGALEKAFATAMDGAEELALLPAGDAAALRGALASRPTAKAVRTSLRRLVNAETAPGRPFDTLVDTLRGVLPEPRPRADMWPVSTFLPFLARPERFGVMRAAETRAVSEMLTFGLRFDPTPNWRTYAMFLRLGEGLRTDLAAAGLPSSDWHDLHGFIWTLGASQQKQKTA